MHKPIREYFVKAKEEKSLVSPDASAEKCITLLLKHEFKSGIHHDYYDEFPTTSD